MVWHLGLYPLATRGHEIAAPLGNKAVTHPNALGTPTS
jgi:hypothetical protein